VSEIPYCELERNASSRREGRGREPGQSIKSSHRENIWGISNLERKHTQFVSIHPGKASRVLMSGIVRHRFCACDECGESMFSVEELHVQLEVSTRAQQAHAIALVVDE
jgi:hypothetical protein